MTIEVVAAGDGVHLVVGPRTNWCLVRDGDSITLIDAAWPRDYRHVVESLQRIGAAARNVDAVILTHAHPDHVGVAERFRADHDATVHTHRDEVGHATGEYEEHVRTIDLLARLWRPSVIALAFTAITRGGLRTPVVQRVEAFDDEVLDVPGHVVPVPTPGHTRGHCSFLLPEQGVLITGDALVNQDLVSGRRGPCLMPSIFTRDWDQAAASLDRLEAIDADVILPGHGSLLRMAPALAVAQAKEYAA